MVFQGKRYSEELLTDICPFDIKIKTINNLMIQFKKEEE